MNTLRVARSSSSSLIYVIQFFPRAATFYVVRWLLVINGRKLMSCVWHSETRNIISEFLNFLHHLVGA